jgi:predicted TPR repeat methyltransferase
LDYYRIRAHILEAMKQRKAAIQQYWQILRVNPTDQGAEAGLVRLHAPRPPAKATGGPTKLR